MPVAPASAPKINLGDVDFSIAGFINTKQGGTIISKTIPARPFLPNSKTLYVDPKGKLVFEVGLTGKVKSKTIVNDGNWHEFGVVHVASEDRLVKTVFYCINSYCLYHKTLLLVFSAKFLRNFAVL